jgi:hypothetical protein
MNGKPSQMFVRHAAMNAFHGSVSHSTGVPFRNRVRKRFTEPYSKLNIPRQVSAVMYCGTAHGRMRSTRQAGFPLMNRWCSTTASSTPSTTWKATLTNVQISVLTKMPSHPQSTSSAITETYWSAPMSRQSRRV